MPGSGAATAMICGEVPFPWLNLVSGEPSLHRVTSPGPLPRLATVTSQGVTFPLMTSPVKDVNSVGDIRLERPLPALRARSFQASCAPLPSTMTRRRFEHPRLHERRMPDRQWRITAPTRRVSALDPRLTLRSVPAP
jgi:hypothetical protein